MWSLFLAVTYLKCCKWYNFIVFLYMLHTTVLLWLIKVLMSFVSFFFFFSGFDSWSCALFSGYSKRWGEREVVNGAVNLTDENCYYSVKHLNAKNFGQIPGKNNERDMVWKKKLTHCYRVSQWGDNDFLGRNFFFSIGKECMKMEILS